MDDSVVIVGEEWLSDLYNNIKLWCNVGVALCIACIHIRRCGSQHTGLVRSCRWPIVTSNMLRNIIQCDVGWNK